MLEGDITSYFGSEVTKLKIYPPKPMILFPALPANVRINLTVSEVRIHNYFIIKLFHQLNSFYKVTEWPRARLIGQSSIQGDNWLIWRQVATISQVSNLFISN